MQAVREKPRSYDVVVTASNFKGTSPAEKLRLAIRR